MEAIYGGSTVVKGGTEEVGGPGKVVCVWEGEL